MVYYTEDFVQPEALLTPDKLGDNMFSTKKEKEEKQSFDVRTQDKPVDDLSKLLGFDGASPIMDK